MGGDPVLHIQTDTDAHEAKSGAALNQTRKQTRELAAIDQKIIGPLDRHLQSAPLQTLCQTRRDGEPNQHRAGGWPALPGQRGTDPEPTPRGHPWASPLTCGPDLTTSDHSPGMVQLRRVPQPAPQQRLGAAADRYPAKMPWPGIGSGTAPVKGQSSSTSPGGFSPGRQGLPQGDRRPTGAPRRA